MGSHGPVPRKTAWMVKKGCSCTYRYGGLEVEPQIYPNWMLELLRHAMPLCGLTDAKDWPDSCNMNLYSDGGMSVGWHSDDERLFQGSFQDIRIISLSFGQARRFELRLNWLEEGNETISISQSPNFRCGGIIDLDHSCLHSQQPPVDASTRPQQPCISHLRRRRKIRHV